MTSSITNLVSLILEGLTGSLSLKLNDSQLNRLSAEIEGYNDLHIKRVQCQEGYLEAEMGLPLAPKIKIYVDSLIINSKKAVLTIHLSKLGNVISKPLLFLLNKPGIKSTSFIDQIEIDFSEKWANYLKELSKEADDKMDCIVCEITVKKNSFKIDTILTNIS